MDKTNDEVIADGDLEVDDFTQEELDSADTDWQKIAKDRTGRLKRLAKQVKKLKAQPPASQNPPDKKDEKEDTSGELDRTDRMFLKSQGINGDEEMALAKIWKQRYKMDVDVMVDDDVFQAKLKAIRDKKAVNDALPDGKGRGGSTAADSVEYYLEKNEFPPADKPKLRSEYMEKKRAAAKGTKGPFYNSQ